MRLARDAWGLPRHAVPAPGRHGHLDPAADRPLPGAAGLDGGPPDGAVGQGLVRRRRLPQDRPARPRDAVGGRALRGARSPARAASGSTCRGSRTTTSEVYDRIQDADTMGVFQIESRAQMRCCQRTRPENLDDLTVQVALVRPGPIIGGAVHPYIERKKRAARGPGYRVPYEHPSLEPVLRDTLGAIVFQDQVIEVAMAFAGFRAGRGGGAAPGDEPQALGGGDPRLRGEVRGRGGASAARAPRRASASGRRSSASRASASPRRTRPPSGCSPTSPPGCGCTTGRSSSARC